MMWVTIFGVRFKTDVHWDGNVWRRDDNGQQSAYRDELLRDWLRDYILTSGDDPDDFGADIDAAIESASEYECLLTTREASQRLGITVAMVRRRAKRLGVAPAVDLPRQKMWTEAQVRRLERR